jgi:hypothetical protein
MLDIKWIFKGTFKGLLKMTDDKRESVFWKMKMATLDAALGNEANQANLENFSYAWSYQKSKNIHYGEAHVSGLIGEREGRKWLNEQGYEVHEFGTIEHYFRELNETSERLKRRRKQAYIEQDKTYIKKYEDKLKGIFGDKFEEMKKFYFEFLPKRRELRRAKRFADQVGGISPDFIVKKNDVFSIVEVKANTSKPTKHQRMCFDMAKNYGFASIVLNVTVENRLAKEIRLLPY